MITRRLSQQTGLDGLRPQFGCDKPNRSRMEELRKLTPARIGVGRAGTRPRTAASLRLRCDHAAARDTVYGEVSRELLDEFGLFTVNTCFGDKQTYLRRPDLGRIFSEEERAVLVERCMPEAQVQLVVSDGLSAEAVEANLRDIYPALMNDLRIYGLASGTPFFVRGGRVACMDAIGDLLRPEVFVLLIGERPGLASAESMSAYLCYRPTAGKTDADRMVISNIHNAGTPPVEAAARIASLVHRMLDQQTSGVSLIV